MDDEFGDRFVSKYLELHGKLTVFLDRKKIKTFEKNLARGTKFANGYLEFAAQNTAGDLLVDLIYVEDHSSPDEFAAAAAKATHVYHHVLESIGDMIELSMLCGTRKKVSKNFVKYRKQVREALKQQAKATAEASPAP
jgi:hypothetical protein